MFRLIAFCGLVGSPAVLVSDVTSGLSAVPSQIFEGGALTVLCWSVWYLLARTIPSMRRGMDAERALHIAEQKEARKDFQDSLRELADSIKPGSK